MCKDGFKSRYIFHAHILQLEYVIQKIEPEKLCMKELP